MSDEQRDTMREFMGRLAGQALGWHHTVDTVTIGLEVENSFESAGYSGVLQIRMLGGKEWGYMITATELHYTRHRDGLFGACRERFMRDLAALEAREARP